MDEEDRLTRTEMMMMLAGIIARRSTCSRLHVGAIIAHDHRPIVTGYNGAPAGMIHCDHFLDLRETEGCQIAVHAEANAIAYAARQGLAVDGASLYCTHEPCYKCSQLIINAGIKEVYYAKPYRLHDGVALLRAAGIKVHH